MACTGEVGADGRSGGGRTVTITDRQFALGAAYVARKPRSSGPHLVAPADVRPQPLDDLPWGQRARSLSQSMSNRSEV